MYDVTGFLDGSKTIDLGHSGGKLHDLMRDLFNDVKNIESLWKHCVDYQMCRDHAQHQTDTFARQMPELVWAYLEWSESSADLNTGQVELYVVGIFFSSAFICQGVIPSIPLHPHTAIMIEALELYCAIVKTISDLQGVQYCPYLACLFSIALDIYLQTCLTINDLVLKALHCDTPDWCLKNACPACTYTLKDEPDPKFKILFPMNCNGLLKHISREAISSYEYTVIGLGEWFIGDDHYLTQSFINQFGVGCSDESLTVPMTDNDNLCAGRWKNMKEDVTLRMYGIFDEASIFMAEKTIIVCESIQQDAGLYEDESSSSQLRKYQFPVTENGIWACTRNLLGQYLLGQALHSPTENFGVSQTFHLLGQCHGHALAL
ncbi:hypothetical protein EDC04DRAFT_2602749 [Pisolithus marmoratus]|nr:hypothetical protein EDC04DRAFT_2602749 [Pisolithus marmoratus]